MQIEECEGFTKANGPFFKFVLTKLYMYNLTDEFKIIHKEA